MLVFDMPRHPNLMGWRSRRPAGKVHIAWGNKEESLCSIRVPQIANRPEKHEIVCANCEAVLRSMGMLSGWR